MSCVMGINISYSANEKYQMSARSWYLHYQLRLREKVMGSALFFGSAMDDALNTLIENKFSTGGQRDPKDVFIESWSKANIHGKSVSLKKTDLVRYSKADLDLDIIDNEEDQKLLKTAKPEWVSLRRKGLMMLEAYEKQVLPHLIDLHTVQQYITIPNEDGDAIIGYVDLIAKFKVNEEIVAEFEKLALSENNAIAKEAKLELENLKHLSQYNDKLIIFDNKTSSIKYKEDSVLTSRQLATYSEAPDVPEHDYEGYIVIPKKIRKKKEPLIPIKIIIDKVDHELVDSMFEEYGETIQGIKLGNFPCSGCEKSIWGCPYKKYCESGGHDTTGLVTVPKGSR